MAQPTPDTQALEFEADKVAEGRSQGVEHHRRRVSQATNVQIVHRCLHIDEWNELLSRHSLGDEAELAMMPVDANTRQEGKAGEVPLHILAILRLNTMKMPGEVSLEKCRRPACLLGPISLQLWEHTIDVLQILSGLQVQILEPQLERG